MSKDRRKYERYKVSGIESNISDGKSAFLVVVEDVSKTGVGVSEIPAGFDETVHKCFATINAPLEDFRLALHPKWVHLTDEGKHKRIGFQIDDPSPEWLDFVDTVTGDAEDKGGRGRLRHKMAGLMAVVSDGKTSCLGVVEDLSENGLRLTKIPADFDDSSETCTVVVHSPSGDVKVSLHPCWIQSTNRGMYKTMGFKVHNPPAGWQKMIGELKSEEGLLNLLVVGDDEDEQDDEENR
jgi:hypothetical protein